MFSYYQLIVIILYISAGGRPEKKIFCHLMHHVLFYEDCRYMASVI